MNAVVIVDTAVSNIDSVARAVEVCGGRPIVAHGPDDLRAADRIILPGVGAFPDGMRALHSRGFVGALTERVLDGGVPLLGICLGMQMLATWGSEGGRTDGLGWIPGEVRRLVPTSQDRRVPHAGWNEVELRRSSTLFREISSGQDFYFVHSYHFACRDQSDVVATTPYCGGFVSAVQRANVYGVQFHLEKSQRAGLQTLRNFLALSTC